LLRNLVNGINQALIIGFVLVISVSVIAAEDNCQSCHDQDYNNMIKASVHQNIACSSCHQGFDQFPHPEVNLGSELCGTCHEGVYSDFQESVHSQLECSSCHEQAHQIMSVSNSEARMHRLQEVKACGDCHADSVPYTSYQDSFHGIGNYFGSMENAVCTDCHSSHLILKETDARSTVHPDNVAETCANCHGIAAKGFAQGKEHFEITSTGYSAPMYWTLKFFTWLTIIVISLLIIHMELELYRRLLNIRLKERGN